MVAELVETTRLWGRTAAAVDVKQVEPLAEHLVKRSYGEPRWDRRRAAVVAPEQVTLYGLPIVGSRTVQYGRIDPAAARELFIRRALVEGDWDQRHAFMRENERRVEEVEALEARARRRDLLASEAKRAAFFDERVPQDVVSGRHFDRWWKQARQTQPTLLDYPMEMLIEGEVAADDGDRPARWKQDSLELALSYRFDPGSAADGVTVHIPLASLGAVPRYELRVARARVSLMSSSSRYCARCRSDCARHSFRSPTPRPRCSPASSRAPARCSRCSPRRSSGRAACASSPATGHSTICLRTCG